MNRTIQKFAHVTGKFGMVINERKTVVMRYDPASTDPQPVSIENTELQDVEIVNYLGSTICPRNDMSAEFGRRVGLARSSFFRLKQRLWNQRGIRKCTKVRMFECSGDVHLALWLRVMDQTRAGHKPTGDNTILPRQIDAGVKIH